MRKGLLLFVLLLPLTVKGQELGQAFVNLDRLDSLPDSVTVFTIEDFYRIIFSNHPVVKQAELLDEVAQQEIRFARGYFDPKLEGNWDVKNFKDVEYYNILSGALKIPTWFPIDPKFSVDRNRGVFLNPERYIAESTDFWQYSAGVNIPLGRGLFIDERRATLKQAQIYQVILEAEQLKMINKILFEAAKDYWNWYNDYYRYVLLLQSIEIAEEIFRRVRLNFDYGEASVIDTIQAKITLQNRITDMQQARIDYIKSGLVVSNYLWDENEAPLDLKDNVAPFLADELLLLEMPGLTYMDELKALASLNHPELIKLENKREQLFVEGQLYREYLKPRLDVGYNFINAPVDTNGDFQPINLDNNYKFDVTFGFPLFLRKERAKVQLNELKIRRTTYSINLKRVEILNEVEAAYTELINTQAIIEQQTENVESYRRLLQAELLNLQLGESDLFKINFQQDKLIEAQSKLIKLRSQLKKAEMYILWAAGIPDLNLREAVADQ